MLKVFETTINKSATGTESVLRKRDRCLQPCFWEDYDCEGSSRLARRKCQSRDKSKVSSYWKRYSLARPKDVQVKATHYRFNSVQSRTEICKFRVGTFEMDEEVIFHQFEIFFLISRWLRHRVQKTGKSRSLKKFGNAQDNALLFRPNCCPLLVHLYVTVLAFTLEYTVPLV